MLGEAQIGLVMKWTRIGPYGRTVGGRPLESVAVVLELLSNFLKLKKVKKLTRCPFSVTQVSLNLTQKSYTPSSGGSGSHPGEIVDKPIRYRKSKIAKSVISGHESPRFGRLSSKAP